MSHQPKCEEESGMSCVEFWAFQLVQENPCWINLKRNITDRKKCIIISNRMILSAILTKKSGVIKKKKHRNHAESVRTRNDFMFVFLTSYFFDNWTSKTLWFLRYLKTNMTLIKIDSFYFIFNTNYPYKCNSLLFLKL